MSHPIKALRSISASYNAGIELPDQEMRWLCEGLNRFLTRQCQTMDQALGLAGMRGGVPWWKEEAIRTRDTALRELAVQVCPEGTAQARARAVRTATQRYGASTWRFDRALRAMPQHYAGGPRALLWQAFSSGAPMPVCERHLRTILAGLPVERDASTAALPRGRAGGRSDPLAQ